MAKIEAGVLIDSWQLIRELGVGGFARVWLAQHISTQEQAALKILHVMSREDIQSFQQEASRLALLSHPNIVTIKDRGEFDGSPWIALHFAPNGTLADILKRQAGSSIGLSPSTVAAYIEQIGSALLHAHNQGVLHRDIKPENLLLDEKHNILVTDFGIAVVAHSSRSKNISVPPCSSA